MYPAPSYPSTFDGSQPRAQTAARPAAGHPRSPPAQDPELGPGPRLLHRPLDRAADRGHAAGRRGLALPRAPPAGRARVDRVRMAGLRAQSAGQVLSAHPAGQAAAQGRDDDLAQLRRGDGQGAQDHRATRLIAGMPEPGGWSRHRRFWQTDIREDVEAELRFHLEMHERDLLAAGKPPGAAREEAERRFGELQRVREACIAIDTRRRERVRRREVTKDMWQDLRFALRTLRNSPGFTLMAVLCVGLGVGVTSTIVSAVHGILIRPLPYPRADELVAVYARWDHGGERTGGINISHEDYA